MDGIKEELRGLRLTALQNRIVLDQILAARGGVCAMWEKRTALIFLKMMKMDHVISEGIKNLTFMSKTLTDREITSVSF